ncbi:MAG TPA: hypothetical protein VGL59_26165 [Polyangia bacterium]
MRPAQASADPAPANAILDWDAGTLDDLIAILSAPALAARVEVFAVGSEIPAGEVHLLAGGVSDALAPGILPNDALDHLRAVVPARFHIEQRLPNPADGDLTYPGADAGTLDSRPLAHLMRYCEQFVITCSIDVWRGNETARVDYRRGEISGVTVGGIDAPERLAEVMRWSSGNYRLVVPKLTLPDLALKSTKATAAAKAAKVEPAAPSPPPAAAPVTRPPASPATNRTIFGMPAADMAAIRAAAEAQDRTKAERPSAAALPAAASVPAPAPAAMAAAPATFDRASGSKTIFGVPAPVTASAAATSSPKSKKQQKAEAAAAAAAARQERKTGARKTLVPRPEIIPPPNALDLAAAAADPALLGGASEVRATQAGFSQTEVASGAAPALPVPAPEPHAPVALAPTAAPRHVQHTDDETSRVPTRAPGPKERPILAYVSVGFIFGLLLLGIYHLVGLLAH